MFCSNCGKELPNEARFCVNCGSKVEKLSALGEHSQAGTQIPDIQESKPCMRNVPLPQIPESVPSSNDMAGDKSFMVAAILSIIPAPCGLHRFYTGKIWTGLIMFFTCGLYFIWSAIDVLRILTNSFTDKQGKKLKGYTKGKAALLFFVWLAFYGLFISAIVNSSSEVEPKPAAPEVSSTTSPEPTKEKDETAANQPVNSTSTQTEKVAENTPKPLPKITTVEKPYEAPILDGAIFTYPETAQGLKDAGFSKTLNKLGLENIKKANRLMPIAAQKAAQNKKCDAVMTVDLSLERSTKSELVFFVWAQNLTKFYFTETELMEKGPALSEQEKLAPLLTRHEVMAEEVIKSQLNFPSTYDRHELGVFTSRTTPSCNEITIEFSAKNAYGLELTYIATVQFDKESKVVGFHMQEKR